MLSDGPRVTKDTVFSFAGDGLRLALAQAHLPALMPALACLTGDLTALDPAWQPDLADQALAFLRSKARTLHEALAWP